MSKDGEPAFAGADWGTSRFRLWLMDRAGNVLAERRSDDGLDASRTNGFSQVLEGHLAAVGAPADLPVVVCGMAGSRQGWMEASYVDIPADPAAILAASARIIDTRRDIRIVPGLAQQGARPNVMRGEETQLLGLVHGKPGFSGLVAMPGTHSKWVYLEGGKVSRFATYLTGELYALLCNQSILRHSIGQDADGIDADHPGFSAGLALALAPDFSLLGTLFEIRAAMLLDGQSEDAAAARLSGMVIGTEAADARAKAPAEIKTVQLVASGRMERLYRKALGAAGFDCETIDADDAVRKGLHAAAAGLWFSRKETTA
ncbi:2-dehydro-3-deoxygalactonokinase [Phyllobacterium phragmitis]|uniref:2-dehydro-3-deoxygalactonokinase n=1 Tax=Phyllobacterium phragmitis TaxID=2670329 RepID=A0A2S9IUQ8_9HYPH|nr:2-dehydro-3-deoxygalactonokinase [Phyllobacterium phragmitis]PRD44264.1 2-dehydro-3-deoxygalactonokinase [Phyllobacterium phragmitis]